MLFRGDADIVDPSCRNNFWVIDLKRIVASTVVTYNWYLYDNNRLNSWEGA